MGTPDRGGDGRGTDWEALEGSQEFQKLVSTRRRFLALMLGVTAAGLAAYTVLVVVAGDGFLADSVIGSFTWGLLLVVVMTLFIFALAAAYSRTSERVLDPLVERVRERAR